MFVQFKQKSILIPLLLTLVLTVFQLVRIINFIAVYGGGGARRGLDALDFSLPGRAGNLHYHGEYHF